MIYHVFAKLDESFPSLLIDINNPGYPTSSYFLLYILVLKLSIE